LAFRGGKNPPTDDQRRADLIAPRTIPPLKDNEDEKAIQARTTAPMKPEHRKTPAEEEGPPKTEAKIPPFSSAINSAIDKGVSALKKMQRKDGTWPHEKIGATALAGLTLLECGVKADDKVIVDAAAACRKVALTTLVIVIAGNVDDLGSRLRELQQAAKHLAV
jgi:hypothetical protein